MAKKVQSSRWQKGLVGELSLLDPTFAFSEEIVPALDLARYFQGVSITGGSVSHALFSAIAPQLLLDLTNYQVPAGRCALITGFLCDAQISVAAATNIRLRLLVRQTSATSSIVHVLAAIERPAPSAIGTLLQSMGSCRYLLRENQSVQWTLDTLAGAAGCQIDGVVTCSIFEFPEGVWPGV